LVFFEERNLAAADGDIDDADLDVGRKLGDELATEEVGRAEARHGAAQRRIGRIPVALLAFHLGEVDGGEDLEAWIDGALVFVGDAGETLHVRLPEAEENVEIRVLGKGAGGDEKQPDQGEEAEDFLHGRRKIRGRGRCG